jgi:hypothetical protein
LAVKIDFQSKGGGIENGAAIAAIAQMALDFTAHFGGQAAFQIFADQADGSFTCNRHCIPPRAWRFLKEHAESQNAFWRQIFANLLK